MSDTQVINDCKERVAFDLMNRISTSEKTEFHHSREYYLTLYAQCRKIVIGCSYKDTIENNENKNNEVHIGKTQQRNNL